MKLIFSIVFMFSLNAGAQTVYSSKKDISDAKEIIFYGYDFSHFKLADAKRLYAAASKDPAGINEPAGIKKYISGWVGYLLNKLGDGYFARKLKTSKVTFDFDYTLQVIKNLNEDELVSLVKTSIPADSIKSILSKYQIKQKEGIGFTIIVECFDKKTETSSAYFTFFDIATKNILMSDHFSTSHADGIGLTSHWGYGFTYTVESYISDEFKSRVRSKK